MKQAWICLGLVAALRPAPAAPQTPPAAPAELRAGAAAVEITPPQGWRMWGAIWEQFNRGVHDPLFAKALVLEQGEEKAALVICDLGYISRDLSQPVREKASRLTGIPASSIVICATHTHGGPEYDGVLFDLRHERAVREKGVDEHRPIDYLGQLTGRCVEAIAAARRAARPVRLEAALAQHPGLAFNRRFHMKNGTVRFNPGKMNPDIVRPAGPTDAELPFLLARDAADGRPLASLTVFAMHVATFGNGQYGADYPMHLGERLRESLGEGLVSLFGQGTAGDINHVDVSTQAPQTSDLEPRRIGDALAETIKKKLPELSPIRAPMLRARSATVQVPLQDLTPEQVTRAREVIALEHQAPLDFLLFVEAWKVLNTERMRKRFGASLPMEVSAIRLGPDTALVALPHEVFVEIGLAIKRASRFRETFILTMAHDTDFYVPTSKAFAEGSYETVTSPIKPGGGEMLAAAAIRLLEELKP